jgi:hypothetical protein
MIDLNALQRQTAGELIESPVFPHYFTELYQFLSTFQLARTWKEKLDMTTDNISKLLAVPDDVRITLHILHLHRDSRFCCPSC